DDGTKVVVYGGYLWNATTAGDLWVLDVLTGVWSQGLPGPKRMNAVCTIAGDQFLLWGGMTEQSNVLASSEMVIYNLTSSKYMKQYIPPALYKDRKPPPRRTKANAPLEPNNPTANNNDDVDKSPLLVGAAVGGIVAGLVLLGVLLVSEARRITGLHDQQEGAQGRRERPKNNPQQTSEDDELKKRLEMLERRQKEIDQTRQLLVQKHQQSNPIPSLSQKRAPTADVENSAEVIMLPVLPQRLSPNTVYSTCYSPESLDSRRTVQAVLGPVEMFQSDSYADDVPREEGEMAQETIEPMYGPCSPLNCAIPDLVYELSPDVGMDWARQQQINNPHAIPNLAED
ncbi:hypothetical protein BGZ95_006534, partial [Linnemannia exigua]